MREKYTHRERLEIILKGDRPDRPAVSLWRHFYHRERTAETLAAAMLEYQSAFGWDFMKINPRASYHVEDWGNRLEWSQNEREKHRKVAFAVNCLDDWDRIIPLPITAPVLAEHLKAVSLIKRLADPHLPLLMTVFSPISIAGDLVPDGPLLVQHLMEDPAKVRRALENITATFISYVRELRHAGADGIFFATTEWATSDMWDYEDYEKFARPYDLKIIEAAGDSALNLLHVCGRNNFLRELSDYPVALLNWESSDPTNPTLEQGLEILKGKTAVGGIDHTGWLMYATPIEIGRKMTELKERFGGKRVIFGPGCTYAPEVPTANIAAVKKSLL